MTEIDSSLVRFSNLTSVGDRVGDGVGDRVAELPLTVQSTVLRPLPASLAATLTVRGSEVAVVCETVMVGFTGSN